MTASRFVLWVVVADSTRARFFRYAGPRVGLEEALDEDLVADPSPRRGEFETTLGRGHAHGTHRYAMAPATDPRDTNRHTFAARVAERLEHERHQGSFDALVLIAPPVMLGELRGELRPGTAEIVRGTLDRELTKLSVHDLKSHVVEFVESLPSAPR